MKYTLILLLATSVGLNAQSLFSGNEPSDLATKNAVSGTLLTRGAVRDNYRLKYVLNEEGFLVPKLNSVRETKEDKQNVVGPGFYVMPEALVDASALIVNGEFEHFLNERNSIAGRVEFISYSYEVDDDDYFESGSGAGGGVGFSYRHYFADYGGFYISPAVEFVVLGWDYDYYEYDFGYSEYGKGTSLAICPNFSAGYRFNIGEVFSLTPSVMLGYRVGISIEVEGEAEGESGPLGGIGVAFGFRF